MGTERGAEGEGRERNLRKPSPSALRRGDQQARCEGRTRWRRIRRRGLSLDERYPCRSPATLTGDSARLGRCRPEFDPEQDQVPVRERSVGRRGGRTQGRPAVAVRVARGRDVPVVHDGSGEDYREPAGEQLSAQATHGLVETNRKERRSEPLYYTVDDYSVNPRSERPFRRGAKFPVPRRQVNWIVRPQRGLFATHIGYPPQRRGPGGDRQPDGLGGC